MAQTLKQFKAKQASNSNKRIKSKSYPRELTIVAEGDSWFDYPLKKDIIDYLSQKGFAIKKFSKAGDTLENMIFGTAYKKKGHIVQHLGPVSLQNTLQAIKELKPKFVLFSGGGNDIVGSEILNYLNHKHSKPTSLINKTIFKAKLERIKIALEFFIQSVHKTNKSSQILMDGYDYAKVNGKGYSFIFKNIKGPWILPSMGMKAITKKKDQQEIIKFFVDEFNKLLESLDNKYPYFHHIDLRGKFPNDKEWDNEIHLKNSGFKEVANIYHTKMSKLLTMDPIEKYADKLMAMN